MNMRHLTFEVPHIRTSLRQLSLAIIVIGAGLGMYLNFYFGNIGWSNILMFAAIVFLPDWSNLLRLKFKYSNKYLNTILVFEGFVLFRMFFSKCEASDYIFLFFLVAFIIGLYSIRPSQIDFTKVILYTWYLGFLCLFFCFYSIISGVFFLEYTRTHNGSGYQSILVDLTMGGNLINFIISCLFFIKYKAKNRKKVTFSIFGILVSLGLLFVLAKRTPLIVALSVIGFFIFKFYPPKLKIKRSRIKFFVIFILLLTALTQVPMVKETIDEVWNYTISGIIDMINGTTNTGMGALERYRSRELAYKYIASDFSFWNYIFGAGYMISWLDAPLLQSFLDLGIIGLVFYAYFIIYYPLRIGFSYNSRNLYIFWGCCLCFYNVLSSMNSGTPYIFNKWIPIILLIYLYSTYKKYCNKFTQ